MSCFLLKKLQCLLVQPYPNDEDVELMSKAPDAYTHAHKEVERLKTEQQQQQQQQDLDDFYDDRRKKPVKVVSKPRDVRVSGSEANFVG